MKKEITILVIEDGKSDLLYIERQFQQLKDWNVKVVSARTFNAGKKIIVSEKIDLCFLDYFIDNQTADEFLKDVVLIRDFVPVILVSGINNEELDRIANKFELDDYLSKEDISQKLLARIIRYSLSKNKERNRARNQEGKYNNLLNNSLEAVFTANSDYHILETNQSFRELIKYHDNRTLDFRELFPGNNHQDFFSALAGNSERKINRTKLISLEGETLEVYVGISRILNGIDNAAYQVVIHDITELERARTALHENEKISLIQRMARLIGHEVRNPLTNIVLATEEMKDDLKTNEDALLMLNLIHRNASRISDLIDNFLDNTRSTEVNRKKVFIEDLITHSVAQCKDRILLKEIDFSLIGMNRQTEVCVDPDKIQVVLTNIIINASEAVESIENPCITIALDTNDNSIFITVTDNGMGMSNDVKENIFQPFYSSKQGGLGLGMANSKHILDDHQAIINIESKSNEGTSINIVIPKHHK